MGSPHRAFLETGPGSARGRRFRRKPFEETCAGSTELRVNRTPSGIVSTCARLAVAALLAPTDASNAATASRAQVDTIPDGVLFTRCSVEPAQVSSNGFRRNRRPLAEPGPVSGNARCGEPIATLQRDQAERPVAAAVPLAAGRTRHAAVSGRAAGGDPDRPWPAAVRRRLPDRGDVAVADVSPRRVPGRQ